jgi:hypothetical protein
VNRIGYHSHAEGRARSRYGYTQRWKNETINSMMKRNLGSALRGKSNQGRERDLRLKVLTHNVMILRRRSSLETEQFASPLIRPASPNSWLFALKIRWIQSFQRRNYS